MDCEREGCGHPLAFHDPCSKCDCPGYEPADRKERIAMLTDPKPRGPRVADVRSAESARLRGVA